MIANGSLISTYWSSYWQGKTALYRERGNTPAFNWDPMILARLGTDAGPGQLLLLQVAFDLGDDLDRRLHPIFKVAPPFGVLSHYISGPSEVMTSGRVYSTKRFTVGL